MPACWDFPQLRKHSMASVQLCSALHLTDVLWIAAILCGVSMWRVDWEGEAVEARKHSIALQAQRLLQGSPCDVADVENSLNGAPQGSRLPGGGVGPIYGSLFSACICRTGQHRAAQHSTEHSQHSTEHAQRITEHAQHSTAQHSTAQHSTAQHSTAQHSTAQHSAAQHSTAQHSTAQHSTAQHSPAQPSTAQRSAAQQSAC